MCTRYSVFKYSIFINLRIISYFANHFVSNKYSQSCLITPEWQEQGDLASVEIEFETDTVVKKIGRGYTVPSGADFNGDYNNDYLIETT